MNDLLLNKKLRSTICFSCHHQPVIAGNQVLEIYVEKENGGDVLVYVHDRLHKCLGTGKANEQYLAELQDTVVKRAHGVFQWAVLVVRCAKLLFNFEAGHSSECISFYISNHFSFCQ